ncbi:MAG: hypothetical protein WCR30_00155 [Clostridia bacterium]
MHESIHETTSFTNQFSSVFEKLKSGKIILQSRWNRGRNFALVGTIKLFSDFHFD